MSKPVEPRWYTVTEYATVRDNQPTGQKRVFGVPPDADAIFDPRPGGVFCTRIHVDGDVRFTSSEEQCHPERTLH